MAFNVRRSPDEIREDLDAVNADIVRSVVKRDELVDEMTLSKADRGMAAHQPERYELMLEACQAQAAALGMDDPEFIKDIFDVIHQHSIERQQHAGI